MSTELIPLFPLHVVLLPGSPLPLHIFEERYKEMIADVMAGSGEFGVVLARDNGIVNIGCTALVERVIERYEDGRLDILTSGRRRFQIVSLDEDKSYLRAAVEFFDDEDLNDAPLELRQQAMKSYQLLSALEKPGIVLQPKIESPRLSFQIAQYIIDLDNRQTLISLRSENERLGFLIKTIPDYVYKQERIAVAKRVAPQNGHAKHVVNS
jgi:Lon protease-like protein